MYPFGMDLQIKLHPADRALGACFIAGGQRLFEYSTLDEIYPDHHREWMMYFIGAVDYRIPNTGIFLSAGSGLYLCKWHDYFVNESEGSLGWYHYTINDGGTEKAFGLIVQTGQKFAIGSMLSIPLYTKCNFIFRHGIMIIPSIHIGLNVKLNR
jgi:hypothetical protein